jgi:YfiH family protein
MHGAEVAWADHPERYSGVDALMTDRPGLALLVRVADCVPIVLAAPDDRLVGVVHAGRVGLVAGVVPAAVDALRTRAAGRVQAWLGPRACGRCYELPATMAADVAEAVPEARSTTSWGTPAADIGAGVTAQLTAAGVEVHDVGADACTIEDERFFSHRREGVEAGRFGAIAVLGDTA